jgi:hypothetical protein
MTDILMLGLALFFFIATVGFISVCERAEDR